MTNGLDETPTIITVRFSLKTLLILILLLPPIVATTAFHGLVRAVALSVFAIVVIFWVARD